MKRILFIIVLFGIGLNTFAQSIGEYDELIVNDELTVRDSTLIEIIEAQTSGTSLDGQNGVYKNGNFFEFGTNALNKNTDLPGGLYNLNLGTVANKINTLTLNGQSVTINSDNSIFLTASGATCEWNGLLLVCGSDTIATLADVRTEIAASLPLLPFNFDYTFSASTTDSRPGAGLFRLNNATYSNVTQIYIDYFDNNSISQSVFLSAPDTGSYIALLTDENNYVLYQLTGALTDAGNYYKYRVNYIGHNGVLAGATTVNFDLSNNVGGGGGGAGFDGNRLDTLGINDSLFLVNGWLTGLQNSAKFSIDTLESNVNIVGQGATKDTLVGAIDLKTAVESESFDKIKFNPIDQPYEEGVVFYDTGCKAITAYNDISEFKEELGRGINVRFFNNTGSTILNGTVIRSVGVHVNDDINFSGDLAGNASLDSILGVAVSTVDVPDQSHGMATVLGQVNGLNTSMYNDNDIIYVSHSGTFTNIPPEPPLWYQILGRVVYADNDSGAIFVKTGETKYSPKPTFTANFEDEAELIENPGIDIYEPITNATNDLFIERRNIGFTFQGDSISPMQDGNYTIFLSYSFQGTVSQTDLYRIGTFIDGVKGYSTSRTASGSNNGGVPYPYTVFLTAGQWISFKINNNTSGTRDCTFTDGTITINFTE